MKITERRRVKNNMWVIQCECGNILHSASEKEYLPQFGICNKCTEQVTKS